MTLRANVSNSENRVVVTILFALNSAMSDGDVWGCLLGYPTCVGCAEAPFSHTS